MQSNGLAAIFWLYIGMEEESQRDDALLLQLPVEENSRYIPTCRHCVTTPHASLSDGNALRSAGDGGVAGGVHDKLKRALNLWDVVGITIGTIIGSGIFASANRVLKQAGSVGHMLMVWVCR